MDATRPCASDFKEIENPRLVIVEMDPQLGRT